MKAELLCRVPNRTLKFAVEAGDTLLGRDAGLKVSLPLEGVSRVHAKVTFDGTSYVVEDMKSTNGTFLNGEPMQRERLRHLDVVSLGRGVHLVFLIRGESRAVTRPGIVRASLLASAPDAAPYEMGLGEATLGRSPSCNVVVDHASVSAQHARLLRTPDSLVVMDLGSANGTFVNGERVVTASLKDGDALSLASVVDYRVSLEQGSVTSLAGAAAPAPEAVTPAPEWRTRLEWNPEELQALMAVQQAAAGRYRPTQPVPKVPAAGKPKPAPPKPAAAPAVGKPTTAPPPAAKPGAPPAAPAADKPKPPAPSASVAEQAAAPPPASATPAAPAKPASAPPKPVPQGEAQPPAAPAPPPTPKPAAPALTAGPAPSAPIEPTLVSTTPVIVREVRLVGGPHTFSVSQPGEYVLGRSAESQLRVTDPMVSRRHARIVLDKDRTKAVLEDLGGANGTLLNDTRITAPKVLADRDEIGVGDLKLVVTIVRGPG